jgi:anti-sigma regulatory factor (Ser/Thr protein kinase)
LSPDAPSKGGLRRAERVGEDLCLVLNNTLEAIEDGRLALLAWFQDHHLDDRAVNRLEVIFEELVSNTIRHGFRPRSDQTLHVRARAGPGFMELTIEDDGEPFDPLAQPAPAPFTSLATAREGGLGVALVKRLASSTRYEAPEASQGESGFRPRNRIVVAVSYGRS